MSLHVLGITPADLAHPNLALALARNGATGLVDLEYVHDAAAATRNFAQLLSAGAQHIGLRSSLAQRALAAQLIELAGDLPLTLITCGSPKDQRALHAKLPLANGSTWLAEALSLEDARELASGTPQPNGLIARGHEAGGRVGADSSFVLLQKLHGQIDLPIYAQGGIGVRAAAACRTAGAAGVVVDDALLLLAESPLSAAQQAELARLNGAECKPLGELLNLAHRIYARPAHPALKVSEDQTRQAEGGLIKTADWAAQLHARIGWHAEQLLPLGQAIGMASGYRQHYGNVARFIQALRRAARQLPQTAAELKALDENSPLAQSHGTRFALAQGPMTRVSDSPAFAADVAKAGALPFLALALMRGAQVQTMLEQTRALAGDLPWGVGMLGFAPQALRDEQCQAIWNCKPPFALIAGGRPDQAAEFEARGIATYIHAPAPALLKLYLDQGARRFVFEGRECGGHVGPIASFPLWEQMIDVLLEHVSAADAKNVHVLFAGGIHDALSGAMVAAMTAPLSERGIKVGCLMGTAYLFTQEIVNSGAVVEAFQDEALRCTHTVNLESGPGHASRCVDTPFARDFYAQRRQMIRDERSAEDIRDALEALNLGRLRIASKGTERNAEGQVVEVPETRQRSEGMYMIGQVATLRDAAVPLSKLHSSVTVDAQKLLDKQFGARAKKAAAKPSDIAIVGIGVTLPGANSPDDYWELVLKQRCILREAPPDRWDPELMYDPDPKTRDRVYSKWGGFLDDVPFDPLKFGIPPRSMRSIDPFQLLTLETAARTLADAGYADGSFDRENASVILGSSGGAGDVGQQYGMRAELMRFVEELSPEVWDRLPEWTEESFAGTLMNVGAGRVANRLDFGGVNFTVDAACGSSLAAINIAVHELETGRSNFVLAGGFDTTMSAYAFMAFAKTQALSATGSPRTFDQAANGIAIAEGVAMIALKRLADAERDGDRIYAVIKSTAGSSDGKALGMTAPRVEGQVRALDRAYAKAGFSPATLGMVEAHGTGTAVGDRTEAQTVARALSAAGAPPRSVAIGSVKTLLGHTKAAAGVSGLIKVALALHHRSLPGHYGVDHPIDVIADPNAPLYLLKDPQPWLRHPLHPRRGAVSAFGFGGTNFHAVLEEYSGQSGSAGGARWSCELFLFRAAGAQALTQQLQRVHDALGDNSPLQPGELAQALAREADLKTAQPATLAIVAADLAALKADLARALAHLQNSNTKLPPNIHCNLATPSSAPPVAFVFPGQGAQQVQMGREAALHLDEVRDALELADRTLIDVLPEPLSARIYPPHAFDTETQKQQAVAITDTRFAQPAIGALSLGYLRFAQRLGLRAQASAGHSYGEYSALMAAGVLSATDFLRLSAARGAAMAEASAVSAPGSMAAVRGAREAIEPLLKAFPGVRVANHNAPQQSVISGPREGVEAAAKALADAGLRAVMLPVSGAFHTELVAPAKAPLSKAIRATAFANPQFTVFSNSSGQAYPDQPKAMQKQLDDHLLSSVEFVSQINAMYAAGSRVFIEIGPRNICAGLVKQILADHPDAAAVALDAGGNGLKSVQLALAELFTLGVPFDASALYAGRNLPLMALNTLAERAAPTVLPKHVWLLSGGCARPQDQTERRTGKLPALTQASRTAARAKLAQQRQASSAPSAPAPQPTPAARIAAPAMAPQASAALSSEAMLAYQQTMRQFLALQERVVQQFLGGSAPTQTPALPALPTLPTLPVTATPTAQPVPAIPVPPAAASARAQSAPVAVAPAPAAAPAVDYKALLLNTVADRTGYPTDMLALDADLEADLGIDSIKRVEIIGALQKALPESAAASIQTNMERYTQARTLNAVLAALADLLPASASAESSMETSARAPSTAHAVDYKALLLSTVADRTGYPTDMLALDADLEADLGIDSIKRVEIIGALQKALPESAAASIQTNMERYTQARTLNAVLAALADLLPASASTASQAKVSARAQPTALQTTPSALPRYLLQSRPAALGARDPISGLALVLGEDNAVRKALIKQLRQHGLTPVAIATTEAEALRQAISDARAQHGAVAALVDLHGLTADSSQTLADWQADYAPQILVLFHAIQVCLPDLARARVVAASRLGGSFGRDAAGDGSALGGAANGILNCLRVEAPGCIARAVDFGAQTAAQIAEHLCDELHSRDREPEVGYVGNARLGSMSLAAPLTGAVTGLTPQADWVVLATGGARGITAHIVETLALPGMRLVLLGRTPEPAAEDAATAVHTDAGALRKALIAAALARGDKPKPVEIDRQIGQILTARELRTNLQTLRARGAIVDYRAVDARDEAALGALIDQLYAEHGRIDLVLHAAGVIEDKLLADKTADSFARVIGTKLDPAFVLSRKLRPQSLKAIAFFTSVAGRYGNRGQSDYAAANESMNRLAWQLHRAWPQTRVMAINWGPWDGGMASEGVKRQMREAGMEPIPLAAGCQFFVDELARGAMNEVELVAGQGPWHNLGVPTETSAATATRSSGYPLLRGTPELGIGGAIVMDHTLNLANDPYLADHVIDGNAVLPMAGALEYMAQFAAAGWPGWQVVEIRDLQLMGGLMLGSDGLRSIRLRARAATHSEPGFQAVTVELFDPARKAGVNYRATVVLAQTAQPCPPPQLTPINGNGMDGAALYARLLFHGSRFHSIHSLQGLNAHGASARAHSGNPAQWLNGASGDWLFDPALIDAAPQLAWVWSYQQHQQAALPARLLRVQRFGDAPLEADLSLHLAVRALDGSTARYDAEYVNAQGQVRYLISGGESTLSAQLNRVVPIVRDAT